MSMSKHMRRNELGFLTNGQILQNQQWKLFANFFVFPASIPRKVSDVLHSFGLYLEIFPCDVNIE